MKITMTAKALAEKTVDAYSADRYRSWAAVAQSLLNRGYNEVETETIMRSKWTRWAADQSTERYGRVTSVSLIHWLDKSVKTRDEERQQVLAMVNESIEQYEAK